MFHLNVRVAWHDNRWNGTVCRKPLENSFCVDLERIREERKDSEAPLKGKWFAELNAEQLPPCKAEGGAFMSSRPWVRMVEHPYTTIAKAKNTHGHLKKTKLTVDPFSTFAVPFYWMLRQHQETIDEQQAAPLPPDEHSPFDSPWVFGRARQEKINELFFGRLTKGRSLAFFYTKSGHPLDEAYSRLLVGVGVIEQLSGVLRYEADKSAETYPLWERIFHHSIRPDGSKGFLLPYHDYLEPTGDAKEDARRKELLVEVAVVPEVADVMAYSYASELAGPEVALSALVKCLEAVRTIRRHGVASGPWEEREVWLNDQIAHAWADRGAFPGTGAALEAMGMRLGTSLALELWAKGLVGPKDDPWPVVDAVLRGKKPPPQKAYEGDIKAVVKTWSAMTEERRALLRLLSRFSLSPAQALRWFDPTQRAKATRTPMTDRLILENPYRIAEADLGGEDDRPVSVAILDRGLLPDATIAAAHPVEGEANVQSPLDPRRVRAGLVTVLRDAAVSGDCLFSEADALAGLGKLALSRPCVVPGDWIRGNLDFLAGEIERVEGLLDPEKDERIGCLQLADLQKREKRLASLLGARSAAALPSLGEDWKKLLLAAIAEGGIQSDPNNARHQSALTEQGRALEKLTTRKLTVLVGRAGTGKTTVLGA